MLYLIRHAHAEDGPVDRLRPLSAKGRAQAERLGRFLAGAREFDPSEVWHSGLVRARETAEIVLAAAQSRAPIRQVADLEPDDDPSRIAARFESGPGARGDFAVVGHNPHLTVLASLLIRGAPALASRPFGPVVVFEKCAMLALDSDERVPGSWRVAWHLDPALLK